MRLRLRTILYKSLLFATILTTLTPGFLLSQTVPQGPAFGITPFGSYAGYHVDSVNMDNGNDIIKIPLFSLPQLGKLALSFSAVSNITYWELTGGCSPDGLFCNYYYTNDTPAYSTNTTSFGIGPVVAPDQIPSFGPTNELTSDCGSCLNYAYVAWSVSDNAGANHPLFYDATNPSQLRSADGSGYLFSTNSSQPYNFNLPSPSTWTLVDPTGTKTVKTFDTEGNYTLAQSDSNGNTITYTPPSGSTVPGFFKDSLQRTIPDIPYPTSSIAGCPNLNQPFQPATSSSVWSVPGPNNTTATFLICYAQVSYHTDLLGNGGQSLCLPNGDGQTCYSEAVGGATVIQSIVLPDTQTYWGFVYDAANPSDSSSIAYATLNQLILPQGGSISYSYYPSGICYSNQQDWQTLALHSRTVTDINGKTKVWNYRINQNSGGGNPTGNIVTDPDGNDTVYVFQDFISPPFSCSDLETTRTTYQGSSSAQPATVLKTETVDQYQQVIAPSPFDSQYYHGYANAFRKNQTTTLNGTASAKSSTGYDTATFTAVTPSCQLSTDGTCPRREGDTAVLSLGMPIMTSVTGYSGSVLKSTSTVYAWQSGSPGVCPASGYFSGNLLNTPSQATILDSNNNPAAQTTVTYDEPAYDPSANCSKGHATTKSMWNNMGTNPQTHTAWTPSGMVSYTLDANGYETQYTYDGTGIFPSKIQQPTTTNEVAHIDQYSWDANTGNMTSHTDQNNVVTNYFHNDPLGRLTLVDSAVGALDGNDQSAESKTSYSYPSATEVDVAQDQLTTGDGVLKSSTFYDGLGRVIRAVGRDGSVVETAYDGLDRVCAVSNPTFNDPGALSCTIGQNRAPTGTDGYTYFSYDALGRKKLQTQPDNNTQQWLYNGNVMDFYDEDQSHRQQTSDALGRLTKVLENDPAGSGALTLETDYTYDPLNNLTSVNQKGASGDTARYRTFVYDSVSRLVNACNPEVIATGSPCTPASGPWSAAYTYDANSNVITRTDARAIVTHYNYDALNRLISKTYTNDTAANTPSLSYGYDQEYPWQLVANENNAVGHLNWVMATLGTTNLVTWTSNDYDQRGNLLGYANCLRADAQSCPGAGAIVGYQFNLDGTFSEMDENAGAAGWDPEEVINFGYDTAGRLNSIGSYVYFSAPSPTTTVFSGQTYYPGGAVKTANLAIDPTTQIPGITLSRAYDNRGRVTGETDTNSQLQTAYNYSVNYDGNGNVTGYNDSAAGTWTVTNDALHRLLNMSGTFGGVAYTAQELYDSFGNRNVETVTAGSDQMQPSSYLHFTAGNNRADEGNYDNAGNPFSDGANNYLYDAENRVCAVQQIAAGGGGSLIGYLYDPNGTRLGKNLTLTSFSCDMTKNGMLTSDGLALTNLYAFGPQGEQLEETDENSNVNHFNVFWEGKVLASYSGPTYAQTNWHFSLNDWVGTKRVVTQSDGSYADSFFSGPFGDFQTPSNDNGFDPSEHHFTSKERDIESGLDYFGARYYNSYVGRFLSPDFNGADDYVLSPVPYADLSNPQTLNLYGYAGNSPLSNVDPDGHATWADCGDGSGSQCLFGDYNGEANQQNGRTVYWNASNGNWDNNDPTKMNDGRMNDLSGSQLMGVAGGMGADFVIGKVTGAIGSMLGRGAEEAAGTAASGAGRTVPDLTNLSNKIIKDMARRGWTKEDIAATVQNGTPHEVNAITGNPLTNKATGGGVIEYVNPANGKFVVIDKATNQVLQVSGPGFGPNHLAQP